VLLINHIWKAPRCFGIFHPRFFLNFRRRNPNTMHSLLVIVSLLIISSLTEGGISIQRAHPTIFETKEQFEKSIYASPALNKYKTSGNSIPLQVNSLTKPLFIAREELLVWDTTIYLLRSEILLKQSKYW
jgi:hypothetical protein